MSLLRFEHSVTTRQLRQFGGLSLALLPAIAWCWGGDSLAVSIAGIVGLTLAAASWLTPSLVRPVFLALRWATWPIGLVIGELALATIFFVVVTPIGWLRRTVAGDPLERTLDPQAATYWRPKRQPHDQAAYFNPW